MMEQFDQNDIKALIPVIAGRIEAAMYELFLDTERNAHAASFRIIWEADELGKPKANVAVMYFTPEESKEDANEPKSEDQLD